jgi:hypothetical protein
MENRRDFIFIPQEAKVEKEKLNYKFIDQIDESCEDFYNTIIE